MGDSSACLMQPFCYASGITNEANQSNPIHALGESISFGRFMSESMAWEKWSTFSNNRYVEEAEKISKPGSVAQKKAFFEAHYKKLAAQKAAALIEQSNNATQTEQQQHETVVDKVHDSKMTSPKSKHGVDKENVKVLNSPPNATWDNSNSNIKTTLPQSNKVKIAHLEKEHKVFIGNSIKDVGANNELSEKVSGSPSMETPKLKHGSKSEQEVLQSMDKKKPPVSSFKLLKVIGISKFTSTQAKSTAPVVFNKDSIATSVSNKPTLSSVDKKRSTPKSIHMSLNFTPIKEINRLSASVMRKFDNARVGAGFSKASKDSSTTRRTRTKASKNELQKCSPLTPLAENKRNKSTSAFISSSFSLRTEESAASRNKVFKENFEANEAQNLQLHIKLKEKAEIKIRKLRHSFCFKAMPLRDSYEERDASKRETEEDPLTHPESPKEGRRPILSVEENKNTLPPQRPSLKNNGPKNFQAKNDGNFDSNSHFKVHNDYHT